MMTAKALGDSEGYKMIRSFGAASNLLLLKI